MRYASTLIAFSLLSSIGCSVLLINSGQNLEELKTRSEVSKAFGAPTTTGQIEGKDFEEFETRRKIAEPWKGIYLAMGYAATLGLGEFVWFPVQLFHTGRRTVLGQHIRFVYDSAGNVIEIRFDGDAVTLPPRIDPADDE